MVEGAHWQNSGSLPSPRNTELDKPSTRQERQFDNLSIKYSTGKAIVVAVPSYGRIVDPDRRRLYFDFEKTQEIWTPIPPAWIPARVQSNQ